MKWLLIFKKPRGKTIRARMHIIAQLWNFTSIAVNIAYVGYHVKWQINSFALLQESVTRM